MGDLYHWSCCMGISASRSRNGWNETTMHYPCPTTTRALPRSSSLFTTLELNFTKTEVGVTSLLAVTGRSSIASAWMFCWRGVWHRARALKVGTQRLGRDRRLRGRHTIHGEEIEGSGEELLRLWDEAVWVATWPERRRREGRELLVSIAALFLGALYNIYETATCVHVHRKRGALFADKHSTVWYFGIRWGLWFSRIYSAKLNWFRVLSLNLLFLYVKNVSVFNKKKLLLVFKIVLTAASLRWNNGAIETWRCTAILPLANSRQWIEYL